METALFSVNEMKVIFFPKQSSTYKLKMHQEHLKYEFQLCNVFLNLWKLIKPSSDIWVFFSFSCSSGVQLSPLPNQVHRNGQLENIS